MVISFPVSSSAALLRFAGFTGFFRGILSAEIMIQRGAISMKKRLSRVIFSGNMRLRIIPDIVLTV
jgi:hypothetical protein